MPSSHRLRLRGQGHYVPGLGHGDVVVEVEIERHTRFERRGDHLWCDLTISLKEVKS